MELEIGILFFGDRTYLAVWDELTYDNTAKIGLQTDANGADALDLFTPFEIGFDNLPKGIKDFLNLDFKVSVALSYEASATINVTSTGSTTTA